MILLFLAAQAHAEQVSWREDWRKCAVAFAEKGAITSERADVLTETSLVACETKESTFVYRTAQYYLKNSRTIKTLPEAERAATEDAKEVREGIRKYVLVDISLVRQGIELDRQMRELQQPARR